MKHCPQCGAEYDEFVQYCFVDGVELKEGGTAPQKPQHQPTPLPAAPRSSATDLSALPTPSGVRPALAPPKSPSSERRPTSIWAIGLLLVPIVLLFAIGGLIVAMLFVGSGSGPDGETIPPLTVAPSPTPSPPSPVDAGVPSSDVVKVQFESDPAGATIWEENVQHCVTPCAIDQPDYAPATRMFLLKREGYQDTPHKMTDPTAVQRVELQRIRGSKPRPKPDDIINIR